ncbi:MAG: hypothetical protein ACXW19_10065, partial [Thermoanaerobaculia bacterium]
MRTSCSMVSDSPSRVMVVVCHSEPRRRRGIWAEGSAALGMTSFPDLREQFLHGRDQLTPRRRGLP